MRVRGLKYYPALVHISEQPVAPHAGAWIEIFHSEQEQRRENVAPHAGAWIEIAVR